MLKWQEVEWLTCEEYLGGLMDFTGQSWWDPRTALPLDEGARRRRSHRAFCSPHPGELGRLAVAKGTDRDEAALHTYLQLLDDLSARLGLLDLRHPGLRKKVAPLQQTCEKVQRLVYELSLSKGSALMGARMKAPDAQQQRDGGGGAKEADGEEA